MNIRELISGGPARLRYVFRYSTSRVQHPESVAEHSYYVALYALMIATWYGYTYSDGRGLFSLDKLLRRALLHDLEEARSGDFPRPFKHSSPEMEAILSAAGRQAFSQLIDKLTPVELIRRELKEEWFHAKDNSLEGRIVEFADFLAVLGFMMQEGAANGNQSIKDHVMAMEDYFANFSAPAYDFLRPLVDQAAVMMKEMFP